MTYLDILGPTFIHHDPKLESEQDKLFFWSEKSFPTSTPVKSHSLYYYDKWSICVHSTKNGLKDLLPIRAFNVGEKSLSKKHFFLEKAHPRPLSLFTFCSFRTTFGQKNDVRLQRNSKSDRSRRRWVCWPLDHHHDLQKSAIPVLCKRPFYR